MPSYIFDLGLAQLDRVVLRLTKMNGACERCDVPPAAQLNGQPHTAENVIGGKVVFPFQPTAEVPRVEPMIDPFYSKPSW
ncbi:hypothetical protein FOXG_22956 [Fusarium oxysporum f. sp. lycopersici 4287]|uniref:Uncharacterized protein n=1 Tax=Fusarium oxysporum f. sp. lycopersici (strain 4287 / CBS 123668 / FGSC 9935 / NRRL 34936) TaxID=426428 RepID=A0A0J9WDH8_FUSO4|nr:uncharacterized protein FOXG_22956 [Fusarium oxysporum f. sp. lycopersici 4287]KNB20811.1 hypothetical protein FOXG_22956 [Fusarium oxysporum f. sp. lycopersici 4287]